MANYFYLTLDTTAPASTTMQINGGAVYTTDQLVNVDIGTTDGDTTGYMMKLWGEVDISHNPSILTTEGASNWITYAPTIQIRLSDGDATKAVYSKIRDDVYNESGQMSDSITLNTAVPVATLGGISVTKISKVAGKNESTFSFTSDVVFTEYKIKIVTGISAQEDTGVQMGIVNGSTNMAASGSFPAGTPINCKITGTDLELASGGDGQKIVKIFVLNEAGIWSN